MTSFDTVGRVYWTAKKTETVELPDPFGAGNTETSISLGKRKNDEA